MGRYLPINMASLPAPAAIVAPSFEAILDARMAYFVQLWTAAQINDPTLPNYDVGVLETDPIKMLQETDAYRETLVDQRINDAVLATMVAYAGGDDLTNLGANVQTPRAPGEQDGPYRARVALAFENLSIGGSYGGYRYQALQAAPVELADVAVYGHEVAGVALGEVRIVCLGANSTGVPPSNVLQNVKSALNIRANRKVNDQINVVAATISAYTVDATLVMGQGADRSAVLASAAINLASYAASRLQIAASVTPFGIGSALAGNSAGAITDVILRSPAAPVPAGPFMAPLLTGTRIVAGHEE